MHTHTHTSPVHICHQHGHNPWRYAGWTRSSAESHSYLYLLFRDDCTFMTCLFVCCLFGVVCSVWHSPHAHASPPHPPSPLSPHTHTHTLTHTHTHTHSQAFIHPSLARFFWSSSRSNPRTLTWSPYEYCNGTFTATRDHMFSSQPGSLNLNEYVFIDFAGSGLVHLCGEFMYIHRLHTQALRPAFEPLLEFKLFSPLLHF